MKPECGKLNLHITSLNPWNDNKKKKKKNDLNKFQPFQKLQDKNLSLYNAPFVWYDVLSGWTKFPDYGKCHILIIGV